MKSVMFYISTIRFGGAERVITNLANRFCDLGYKVSFLINCRSENEYYLDNRINVEYTDIESEGGSVSSHLKNVAKVSRFIKKNKPDSVLSFMSQPNLELLMVSLFNKQGKKYVSVRNTMEYEYSGNKKQLLVRLLFPKAAGVILQTNENKKWFEERNIKINSRVIPNQVAAQFFDRSFSGERKNIVSVGRLEEQKNQKLLIRAFNRIKDQTEENLIIYGKGTLRDELEGLVAELKLENRVFLPGVTENVPEKIIGSRLFVLSSDFEGMPNALLEAIALGVPSISTDCPCGGPGEIITEGENGFLVPVGDEIALAEKMKYVLSLSESEIARISQNAKNTAERYRPEKIFRQWEEFLTK